MLITSTAVAFAQAHSRQGRVAIVSNDAGEAAWCQSVHPVRELLQGDVARLLHADDLYSTTLQWCRLCWVAGISCHSWLQDCHHRYSYAVCMVAPV